MIAQHRILVFDGHRHDRKLLALALRNAQSSVQILEAARPIEIVHHVTAGPIDALIAEPGEAFSEIAGIAAELRKHRPQCLFWLFTAITPNARACAGHGVDGLTSKTSEGFLSLPEAILERLRAVEAVHGHLRENRNAVSPECLATAACLLSKNGTVALVNTEFEQLLELPRYDLVGRAFEELIRDPEKQEEWRQRFSGHPFSPAPGALVAAMKGAASRNPVCAMTVKRGEPDADSTLTTVSAVDITEAVNTVAVAAAPPSEAESDGVLYSVAHDLQPLLNALSAYADDLAREHATEDGNASKAIRRIGELTVRMQSMLDGMIEMAAVRRKHLAAETVSLDAALQDAIANLRHEIEATGAEIEHQPLPEIQANHLQMVRVFQNLLANALKFRSAQPPQIRIGVVEYGGTLRVRVKDNGIGIDPKDADRIFGLFQRLHGPQDYPGMGVGLAICQQIVRAHGGKIRVESAPGRGASFILEFPLVRAIVRTQCVGTEG